MNIEERIKSFALLGETLRESLNKNFDVSAGNGRDHSLLESVIDAQVNNNPWFTSENVRRAIASIADELTKENLIKWTSAYNDINNERKPLRVAVIMAGNIPLVGFHDFLSVLITGNNLVAKTSSKDSELLLVITSILCKINPGFNERIEFTESSLSDFDAVIATGSDNSSRYFDYYFSKYPNIIRKNRNGVAVIQGDESDDELESLGRDIFSYFGLGCRNVSKIFVPDGYNFEKMFRNWINFS